MKTMKMNVKRVFLLFATLTFVMNGISLVASAKEPPKAMGQINQSRQNLAYSLGVQAYIYGYPLVVMERTRQLLSFAPGEGTVDFTVSNVFTHIDELATPESKAVVSPNVDTIYSIAWLDLSKGPVVLKVPDTHDRYYVMQFLDAYTNSFANIGRRTTGTKAGKYAVVGPDWKGILPYGIKEVKSPTNTVWILGRIMVKGEKDLEEAAALQRGFVLQSLDGKSAPLIKKPILISLLTKKVKDLDALDFFKIMTDELIQNPPPKRDDALLRQFEPIGINLKYGFHANRLDKETVAGLVRAAKDAYKIIENSRAQLKPQFVNGWMVLRHLGTYGDAFLKRAVIAQAGLGADVDQESMYPRAFVDQEGRRLNGRYRYVIHFKKNELPPVNAFWSITMYGSNYFLVANSINRYAIGDHTEGLKYNTDGSLDIFVQNAPPAQGRSNWLPAPKGGFNMILRLYQPGYKVLNGTYEIPPVKRVD